MERYEQRPEDLRTEYEAVRGNVATVARRPWVVPASLRGNVARHEPGDDRPQEGDPGPSEERNEHPAGNVANPNPAADFLNEAARLFAAMTGGGPTTFQTFDDGPWERKHLVRVLHGTLDEHAAELRILNAQGAGVYWMVNEGDCRGRRKENVVRVRALFLDLDGPPLEPVLETGVKPHAVVVSSPGRYHVYWRVIGCDLTQFKQAQKALALRFGGDKSVNDLPRVLRVPGFMHGSKGSTVRLHSLHEHPPFEREALLTALGCSPSSSVVVPAAESRAEPTEEGRRILKSSQSSSVLLRSSSVGAGLFSSVGGQHTLPLDAGQRNECLFRLARRVKRWRPDATLDERRFIVSQWHELALPVIQTKDFAVTFEDFERGFAGVAQPHGAIMESILKNIDNAPLPLGVVGLLYGDKANRLVRLCVALQAHQGDETFFLSARQAGEILGVHFTDANKMLSRLARDGVIELIIRGHLTTSVEGKRVQSRASRYRFTWPGDGVRGTLTAPPDPA